MVKPCWFLVWVRIIALPIGLFGFGWVLLKVLNDPFMPLAGKVMMPLMAFGMLVLLPLLTFSLPAPKKLREACSIINRNLQSGKVPPVTIDPGSGFLKDINRDRLRAHLDEMPSFRFFPDQFLGDGMEPIREELKAQRGDLPERKSKVEAFLSKAFPDRRSD